MWRLVACLLTLLVPGAGHALAGRLGRGLIWFALGVAVLWGTLLWPPSFLGLLPIRILAVLDLFVLTPRGVTPRGVGWGTSVATLLAGVATFLMLRLYLMEGFVVPAAGMAPTLAVGDHIIARTLYDTQARGDVIVFRFPPDPTKDFVQRIVAVGGQRVAVRGQVLHVDGAAATLRPVGPAVFWSRGADGAWKREASFELEESVGGRIYRVFGAALESNAPAGGPPAKGDFPGAGGCAAVGMADAPGSGSELPACTVPAGTVFVLGDNRLESSDSRSWGPVPVKLIRGKVVGVYWSSNGEQIAWERFGRIR
jgi:signal peptidase I